MIMPQSICRWLRLPSRIALILGMGALSTAGAQADAPGTARDAAAAPKSRGELVIRSEGGKVYLSEAGGEFREMPLGNSPEAQHLRQLLEKSGAAGAGFHWSPFGKAADPTPEKSASPGDPAPPDRTGTQQKPPSPTPSKPAGSNAKG